MGSDRSPQPPNLDAISRLCHFRLLDADGSRITCSCTYHWRAYTLHRAHRIARLLKSSRTSALAQLLNSCHLADSFLTLHHFDDVGNGPISFCIL
eukprot:scaffold84736_cov30-Tisochrysis_lutea.AAC.4